MKNILMNVKVDSKSAWTICATFCFAMMFTMLPELAAANTTLDNTICKVVNTLTGRAGKAIATIGVVFLGIGLFMGKMSWSVALATGLGIAAIFGAGSIINLIGGGDAGSAANC